ncbi:hypothetical protein QBC45DRAFT_436194 [Copromyces sp. CBS 386.78]|nr:hypothetical protein QBC45DRAFT_436194 [Copromyces sp. CBS 386.78]
MPNLALIQNGLRGSGTGISSSGNIGSNLSDSGLKRSDIGTGFNSGNIGGNPNDSSLRGLGKGSGFGYNEAGGGLGSGGFGYYSGLSGRFSYPSGPGGPPSSLGGPGGLRGPSSLGGPYSSATVLNPILYYYYKVLCKDLERFKGSEGNIV